VSAGGARGAGRALVALYALFAVAAGGRSAVQLATRWQRAPLAYALSALAAAVYVLAAVSLARPGGRARRLALAACSFELGGVLVVGALSVAAPARFPDATVWSWFGAGYGFVPLVLPVLGLAWLLAGRRS
jgi:hypothetical protein